MFGGGANPLAAAIKKQRKQESDEVNKTGSLLRCQGEDDLCISCCIQVNTLISFLF